ALKQGSKVVSRVTAPLRGDISAPGTVIDGSKITAETLATDPALAKAVVFETAVPIALDPKNNQIVIHTWGNDECCLAAGSAEAFLYTLLPNQDTLPPNQTVPANRTAVVPVLKKGDYLLFEEVLGPVTGLPADASPSHRQVVQIDEDPEVDQDP